MNGKEGSWLKSLRNFGESDETKLVEDIRGTYRELRKGSVKWVGTG